MADSYGLIVSILLLSSSLRLQVLAEVLFPELEQLTGDLAPLSSNNETTTGLGLNQSESEGKFLDRSCRIATSDIVSYFSNPSYPSMERNPIICQHVVTTSQDYCALRVNFLDAIFTPRGLGCTSDTFQILNSLDTPAVPQCGLMAGYQFTVRTVAGSDVTILVTSQSETLWNISLIQIPCSNIKASQALLPKECGVAGPKRDTLRDVEEEVKLIRPAELLKDDDGSSFPFRETKGPEDHLRKVVMKLNDPLRIVNGNETGVNEFPWQVLLLAYGKPLCGGSLISDQYILTAGHCSSVSARLPLASILVADLGDHDLQNSNESPNRVFRIQNIIPHIKNDLVTADLALLKLHKKVEFNNAIRPICLPPDETPQKTYDGDTVWTSGWGKTGDSVISPVLRKAELSVVPLKVCRKLWDLVGTNGGEVIEDSMICAGGGDKGPCNGDSGGPLIIKDETGDKYNLIGITSFGSLRGCAIGGVPSVFTRVSSFLDWILLNTAAP